MKHLLICMPLMAAASATAAQEQIPYPVLDYKRFCTDLVSKMLDPIEKNTEELKCVLYEMRIEAQARSYWKYVPLKQKKYVA